MRIGRPSLRILVTAGAAAAAMAGAGVGCAAPARSTEPPRPAPLVPFFGDPLIPTAARGPRPAAPGRNVPVVKVDTVGYPASWTKIVIFNVDPRGASVVDASGRTVLRIPATAVTARGIDPASQDPTWQVDLSAVTQPGRYAVVTVDGMRSDPFVVAAGAADAYRTALIAVLKSFYFQRTRTKLEKPYAVWEGDEFLREGVSHAHDDVGWLFEEYPRKVTRVQVEAGWHDAGNFDMYVPSTAPSAHALLRAYERHPELFKDGDLVIPESGNGVPDILDEASWGLRWVLSMQQEDGGIRVREANAMIGEPGPGPADRDRTTRWLDRAGSASTAKGCALAAIAARIYRPFDAPLAARAEAASRRAWAWLERHPQRVMVPPVGRAAIEEPYQLWDDGPKVASDAGARLVAAVETWRSFKLPAAMAQVRVLLSAKETTAAELEYGGWGNLSRWALMDLAALAGDAGRDTPPDLRAEARARLLASATALRQQIGRDGYLCATKPSDYYWSSNAVLLEKAEIMIHAAELDPAGHGWGLEAAREQWHWILGRNPNGFSMLTRVGKGPRALYHMEWGPLHPKIPPGFLIGGPNSHNMGFLAPGAPAKALLWEAPRALSSGTPKGELWHWQQSDLWDSGFIPDGSWKSGWWCVDEPDIYNEADAVLIAAEMQR